MAACIILIISIENLLGQLSTYFTHVMSGGIGSGGVFVVLLKDQKCGQRLQNSTKSHQKLGFERAPYSSQHFEWKTLLCFLNRASLFSFLTSPSINSIHFYATYCIQLCWNRLEHSRNDSMHSDIVQPGQVR